MGIFQVDIDKINLPLWHRQHTCFHQMDHTLDLTSNKLAQSAVSSRFPGLHGQELIVAVVGVGELSSCNKSCLSCVSNVCSAILDMIKTIGTINRSVAILHYTYTDAT